jgi:hypothetical protein
MGIRALEQAEWLIADELAPSELALRRRLLNEQRDLVFACRESAEGAAGETAALIDDWQRARGQSVEPHDETHPLVRAGLAVQEDLCLMVRRQGAWHLDGAMLCFPSMWSLRDKLDLPMARVHGPVDHYAQELSSKADTFLDRLIPGRLVTRRNLSLWPCCLLFVPTLKLDASLWDPVPLSGLPRLWLRSERQTLRRLPGSGAILFTIKVQMVHLSALGHRPDLAATLAAWLRGPGGESRRQQLGQLLGPDLAWLDGVAASASA